MSAWSRFNDGHGELAGYRRYHGDIALVVRRDASWSIRQGGTRTLAEGQARGVISGMEAADLALRDALKAVR